MAKHWKGKTFAVFPCMFWSNNVHTLSFNTKGKHHCKLSFKLTLTEQ